ncbi:MAG: peptidylprolyl isomerase, partial [Thermoanaerobaculia bacterium]|nr:peptidylprolyl isomerase [Thermoanaerobaculia bacterium]
MRISTRNFLGSTALVLSFGALWADAEAEIGRAREVVASYRSTVTEAELESWRRFENRPATSDWNLDLRELILLKSLAAEAERLGIDQRVDVKVAVELAQAPMVELAHRRELARTTEPSDAEVEAYYQRIKDIFTLPRRVRLRTVFKRYPLEADAVDKTIVLQEMKDLRRRAVAGEDFGELASEHSDSQTRFQKGLIGNVSQGTLDAKVDAIAMAMRPGEISDIIELPTGLTMLYCEKILPKVERTADELRSIARKRRTNQLLKKAWADNQTSWLEAAAPNYHWQVLDQRPLDKAAVLVVHRGGSLTVRQTEALVAPASLQELRRE